MVKSNFLHVIFLTLILGSGCSKNDHTNVIGDKSSANSKSNVNISNDPNAKFIAQQTTLNSFESSNTYNNYGFAYRYESRSGDGEEHFYKSIQEFTNNDITNQRNILAETWVEVSKEEYLQTEQHYDQTGELVDLQPKILQSTPIYQKFVQFVEEQQARQAEFEKKRADFNAEFEQRRADFDADFNRKNADFEAKFNDKSAEFDKNWDESTQPSIKSKNLDSAQKETLENLEITEPELLDDESQPENSSAL